MSAVTRLGEGGYGVRRAGSFAGKGSVPAGAHPVGIITRLALDGYGVRRYSSFAGKTPSDVVVAPIVGTVGGGRRHGSTQGFTKRRWLELLEEIRLEKEALAAPTRAKKALQAIAQAERQAAQLAEQLEFEEAEELARTLVAAERAKTAVEALKQANAAVRFMRDLQARIDDDEEEVLMLLLS